MENLIKEVSFFGNIGSPSVSLTMRVNPLLNSDHFFALGGHSLKAVMLAGILKTRFGLDISPAELMRRPRLD
ncbi:phosphopantetheine-binding protein, partial [bacterium]|nr:phosphopantetheine-binding protein [bacterium]